MADGVCGKGYQPHNMSRVFSTSEDTAISHTGYVRPVDQALVFEMISQKLIPYVSKHKDGHFGFVWWHDKHWLHKDWPTSLDAECKNSACRCCRQNRFGLDCTECEQCRAAWIMSTVNREVARAVITDASVSTYVNGGHGPLGGLETCYRVTVALIHPCCSTRQAVRIRGKANRAISHAMSDKEEATDEGAEYRQHQRQHRQHQRQHQRLAQFLILQLLILAISHPRQHQRLHRQHQRQRNALQCQSLRNQRF